MPLEAGRYADFYRGVVTCLRDGSPPPVDPSDAVAVIELIERLHREQAELLARVLGWFPMQGWLEEFARRGLATYDAASSTWSVVVSAPIRYSSP